MTEKPLENKVTTPRSRSESQNRDMSINPFFNFLKDFKDSNGNTIKSSKELAKVAGERWRSMSEADKSPYVNAAKELKEAKNRNPPKIEVKPKEIKIEKAKKKVKRKRCCSRCGHREGSPVVPQDKVATRNRWRRKKRGPRFPRREPRDDDEDADDDDDDDDDGQNGKNGKNGKDPDTDESQSRSRSRSESGSKSRDSGASDSSATFY